MTIHVVTAGQTLYAIGELYGVAPGLIARYNNLSAPYELAVGQSLVILKPKELYTVQEGDTLQKIAQKYCGSSADWIYILERNRDCIQNADLIYPDMFIVIPNTESLK